MRRFVFPRLMLTLMNPIWKNHGNPQRQKCCFINSNELFVCGKLHRSSSRINHNKEKKHTTDAEPHIKNHPDQKSLCPLRIYPLIADTYGRPAQSVLTTKPLICVRLVAENFKEAVLIIPPPREQLNRFC